jgi:glyoxylase-like metal-dependent hydrolase (beta-lactamase superfamily II)
MKQLFDGVFMLEGEVGGRPLQLMYLKGSRASALMDTGCAHDPTKFIAPQIRDAGGDPAALTWIINTHPDLDHICGNHEMKQIAPGARIICGDADRHIVSQGLEGLMRYRYDVYRTDHQIFYEGETLEWLQREGAQGVPVDITVREGEHLDLGDDWVLEFIHVPGHSAGHIGMLDPKHAALYGGDSIHGSVYIGLDGTPKFCPTYEDIDPYLATIRRIETLPVSTYVGCHWPVKRDREIAAFCRESREYIEKVEQTIVAALRHPRTLRDLCIEVGPQLGNWPRAVDIELVYSFSGHLERMLKNGRVQAWVRSEEPRVLEYVWAARVGQAVSPA